MMKGALSLAPVPVSQLHSKNHQFHIAVWTDWLAVNSSKITIWWWRCLICDYHDYVSGFMNQIWMKVGSFACRNLYLLCVRFSHILSYIPSELQQKRIAMYSKSFKHTSPDDHAKWCCWSMILDVLATTFHGFDLHLGHGTSYLEKGMACHTLKLQNRDGRDAWGTAKHYGWTTSPKKYNIQKTKVHIKY